MLPGCWSTRCRCRCLARAFASLERIVASHASGGVGTLIAIEATGSLHRAWASELERRHPGGVRLFAPPSKTKAGETQLGSGRFKTDDRDCAALTYLAGQGAGWLMVHELGVEALRAAVGTAAVWSPTAAWPSSDCTISSTRWAQVCRLPLVMAAPSRLSSRPARRCWPCAAAFAGRAPTVRSLQARAPGRFSKADAPFWADRWREVSATAA